MCNEGKSSGPQAGRVMRLVVTALTLLFMWSCDSVTAPLGGIGGPIWFLENTWVDEQDANHTVFFSPTSGNGTDTGTLEGDETLPDGTNMPLEGSWTAGNVQYTVQSATPPNLASELH